MVYGMKAPCSQSCDALKRLETNGLEMTMRKFIVGAALAAMVAGSSVAQAAPVAIDSARTASSVGQDEQLRGKSGTHIVLGIAALAILIFILFKINKQDGDDLHLPHSP
jgi:hypothetical protein